MPVPLIGHFGSLFGSRAARAAARETIQTNETPKSPIQSFFENLTLKSLIYDSGISFADDLPSSQLPLTSRSFFDGERNLESIFNLGYLSEEVEFFFSESDTIKEKEKEVLNVKLSITYDSNEMSMAFGFDPYYVYDRRDVLFALEHGPIRSAEKLAALLNPDIAELHFTMLRRDPRLQMDGIDSIVFTRFNPSTNERNFVRCIIVPLAPWEFTSKDFESFTQLGAFTESDNNVELMWSYLHDVCTIYECDYFIVTTYENWAFGRFSHTYEQGLISEPIRGSSKDLVMKYLTYWILNSCFTTDTAVIQEILRDELQYYLLKVTKTYSFRGYKLYTDEKYHVALVECERIIERPATPDAPNSVLEPEPGEEHLPKHDYERQEDVNSIETDSEDEDLESIIDTDEKELSFQLMQYLGLSKPGTENPAQTLMDVEVWNGTEPCDSDHQIRQESFIKPNAVDICQVDFQPGLSDSMDEME